MTTIPLLPSHTPPVSHCTSLSHTRGHIPSMGNRFLHLPPILPFSQHSFHTQHLPPCAALLPYLHPATSPVHCTATSLLFRCWFTVSAMGTPGTRPAYADGADISSRLLPYLTPRIATNNTPHRGFCRDGTLPRHGSWHSGETPSAVRHGIHAARPYTCTTRIHHRAPRAPLRAP